MKKKPKTNTVFIMSWPSVDYVSPLTWGDGSPRIYERDKYDGRLAGFGKLRYFDDFDALATHFLAPRKRKNTTPVQVSTDLMNHLGFSKREVRQALREFHESRELDTKEAAAA